MGLRGMGAVVLALGLGVGGSALAQDKQGDFNVFLRGGVGGYTGEIGELSETGPAWGLTVNVQPVRMLGFEVSYDGTKNDITDDRFAQSPALIRHGATSLLKVSPPFERIRPFVGAGLGVSYVSVRGEETGPFRSDLMQEVPVAAGVEFNSGAITAGLRGTYRVLVDDNFADAAVPGNPDGGLMEGTLMLGGRF